jgi:hypothetical protein
LAAESHVDNSIKNPFAFAQTNIQGTLNLLEAARQHWGITRSNNVFTIFQPMRFLEALVQKAILQKLLLMTQDLPTLPQKQLQII